VPVIDCTDRPPDDDAREEVQDGGQIQLAALADLELGGVADPALIGGLGRELPVEEVGRDR
jgi:hypothetical protein